MKKALLAIFLVAGLGSVASAQEKNEKKQNVVVPSAVQNAFRKAYPNVKAKWEKEDGKYEAGFTSNGHEMSVLYSATGVLEESEMEIGVNQLPATATKYVQQHQLGKIKEASKITKADGSVQYEAEVKRGDALFDAKGNFVQIKKD